MANVYENYDVDDDGNGAASFIMTCRCGLHGTQYYDYIAGEQFDDGFICSNDDCEFNQREGD